MMIPIFGDLDGEGKLVVITNYYYKRSLENDYLLLHLLQGEAIIIASEKKYILNSNKMMTIQSNQMVTIESKRDDTYLLVYTISRQLLNLYGDMISNTIETKVIDNRSNDVERMINISRGIALALTQNKGIMDFHIRGLAFEFLHMVTKNFLVKRNLKKNSDVRIFEAFVYIECNYKNNIGLEEIASYFGISSGYFSRFFKDKTGTSFLEYLSNYRLEKASKLLESSSDRISVIAEKTGFPNVNAFNKKFKKKFGCTPRIYRSNSDYIQASKKQIQSFSEFSGVPSKIRQEADKTEVKITKDNSFGSNNFPWKHLINMGSAEDLLQYDLRNHIKLIKKELNISYIRFWNLFTKGMNIDPTVTNDYNFEKIDSILDFLLEEGLKPFIELRYKVRRIHRSTKKALIFENEDFKFRLNSYEWFDMMEKFMKHINNRYGKKIVNEWMFEFSFEHYQGKEELKELISHYKRTYEIIKCQNTLLKVGGPGSPAQKMDKYCYKEDLLTFQKERVNFDFISYTIFPYLVGSDGEKNAERIQEDNFLGDTIEDINKTLSDTAYKGTELFITEWNNTISNRNTINDSIFKGSYLIKNFATVIDKVDVIAYWIGSDLFSEFMDSRDIIHGGAGLIAKGSLMKPVFQAYRFMNFLDNKIILNTNRIIVSHSEETDEYNLIMYNYHGPNMEYYMTAEDEIHVKEIVRFFDSKDKDEFRICFEMDPRKKFQLRSYRVNNDSGNIISGWRDIGFKSSLKKKDIEYLKKKAEPKVKFKQVCSDLKGTLLIKDILEPNEFVYISISPLDES